MVGKKSRSNEGSHRLRRMRDRDPNGVVDPADGSMLLVDHLEYPYKGATRYLNMTIRKGIRMPHRHKERHGMHVAEWCPLNEDR